MTTYTVVRKIASGGNATVYVAKAVSLGIERLVALKKPHPHLVDEPTFVAAFHREAAVAVRLRHPNVVQVLDVVEHEAVPCLVLELVEGPMLSALIRSALARPEVDTTAAAVAIVAAASRGLHALHELRDEAGAPLGLVHRDVSPQNVLVGRDGITKLSDFGLAKATASGDASTTEGVLKGKVGYLSPEYIRGEPVDRRSDVFAMGVVLWEALAKKRLFRADREPDALGKILGMPIPELPAFPGSAELDEIVARALARDPRARYASATDLADALDAVAKKLGLDTSTQEIARVVSALSEPMDGASTKSAPPAPAPSPPDPGQTDEATVREMSRTDVVPTEVPTHPAPLAANVVQEPPARGRGQSVAVSVAGALVVLSVAGLVARTLSSTSDVPPSVDAGPSEPRVVDAAPPVTKDAAPEVVAPPVAATATAMATASATAPHTKPALGQAPVPHARPVPSVGPRPNPYGDGGK
jgi:serine/threonine-protein kinase